MQFLYTTLLYLIQPIIWLRLLFRSRKSPAYRKRIMERYGFCKGKVRPNGILIHAVSVGETVAATPLIKALQKRYPTLPITVTTMTPTGSERVKANFGESVSHVYLPYDLPNSIKRFLNQLRPKLVIIMETELWPNLICALYKREIPLIIANARLSERSAKGYAKLGKTIRNLLPKITMVAAQNQIDGDRFIRLGLPTTHLSVTGSIKFDIDLTDEQKQQIATLKQNWQLNRSVLIAASTHSGEDELILTTFKQLLNKYPTLLLILVPRHPERFKAVEKLLLDGNFTYSLFSKKSIPTPQTEVVLGDTMGELMQLYGVANVAYVGGSLVERGGHNPLEPALFELPIIMGEHVFNFNEIVQQLIDAKGLTICTDQTSLFLAIDQLLKNPDHSKEMGENNAKILEQNQGALDRLLALIKHYLP